MVPPGKTSGLTTNESVENASRTPPTSTTAESPIPASAADPNAGRNRCSMSSADIAPPPPWPITMFGESRSGAGHTHSSMSMVARASAASQALRHLEPPIQVVRRARALGRNHRRAKRIARRAQGAERRALVRLDQALQHLTGAAHRGLLGVDVGDGEPVLGVVVAVGVRQPPAAARDHADAAPRPVGHLEDVQQHRLGGRVALGLDCPRIGVLQLVAARFQLQHRAPDSFEDVERLEPGHDDRECRTCRTAAGTPRCPSPCRRARRPGTPAPGMSAIP